MNANKSVTAGFSVSTGGPNSNLSLTATASASSAQTGHAASAANDGSTTTRWASNGLVFPSWLEIDLQTPHTIDSTQTMFELSTQYYQYKIETSLDNATWILKANKTTNTVIRQNWPDAMIGTTARYMRLTITNVSGNMWPGVWEFRCFGRN
jgi:hypothetical protein